MSNEQNIELIQQALADQAAGTMTAEQLEQAREALRELKCAACECGGLETPFTMADMARLAA